MSTERGQPHTSVGMTCDVTAHGCIQSPGTLPERSGSWSALVSSHHPHTPSRTVSAPSAMAAQPIVILPFPSIARLQSVMSADADADGMRRTPASAVQRISA
jgi:hypothetical protein